MVIATPHVLVTELRPFDLGEVETPYDRSHAAYFCYNLGDGCERSDIIMSDKRCSEGLRDENKERPFHEQHLPALFLA